MPRMKYCEECTRLVLRYGRKNLDFACDCEDCVGPVDDMDDVAAICSYVELKAENKRLREALEALMDVQNGPPLVTYTEDWNKAIDLANEALEQTNEAEG